MTKELKQEKGKEKKKKKSIVLASICFCDVGNLSVSSAQNKMEENGC